MSTNNLTQPNKNHKYTRRAILGSLATIHLAALAMAVPFPAMAESAPIEYAPTQLPPYGPPARTAILDQWLGRIDEVMAGLSEYRRIIVEARALPPAEVDGVKMVNFESEIHALCDNLVGYIDCDYDGDNLITALTGRGAGPVCVEAELKSDSHVFDRDFWQREVDAVSGDHPEERGRLQALLNAKYAGVL